MYFLEKDFFYATCVSIKSENINISGYDYLLKELLEIIYRHNPEILFQHKKILRFYNHHKSVYVYFFIGWKFDTNIFKPYYNLEQLDESYDNIKNPFFNKYSDEIMESSENENINIKDFINFDVSKKLSDVQIVELLLVF